LADRSVTESLLAPSEGGERDETRPNGIGDPLTEKSQTEASHRVRGWVALLLVILILAAILAAGAAVVLDVLGVMKH
jgi:hypothetical protein